jgi:ubiquinone/menaquinone biosynthesis C-methylase UbiE/uncharacterized protein YbaR (Trm112 family)
MFTPDLLALLRCPTDHAQLELRADALVCTHCATAYPIREGYVELLPRAEFERTTRYADEHAPAVLDYRDISVPLLSAKIKNDLLNDFLRFQRTDTALDLGCGNGKFAYWNRAQVGKILALDLAPWFADQAKAELPLICGDIRVLPFDDAVFDKVFSIDVLEHLTLDDIARVLDETRRVLKPRGRFFVFSNTREKQTLSWAMAPQRAVTRWLVRRGMVDFTRDAWRKSDHVKAIATYEELKDVFERHGFNVLRVAFWNGVFQGWIENVLVKLGEGFLSKRAKGKNTLERQATARQGVRERLARRDSRFYAPLAFLTAVEKLDIVLFGRLRAGPYFVVVEKVDR